MLDAAFKDSPAGCLRPPLPSPSRSFLPVHAQARARTPAKYCTAYSRSRPVATHGSLESRVPPCSDSLETVCKLLSSNVSLPPPFCYQRQKIEQTIENFLLWLRLQSFTQRAKSKRFTFNKETSKIKSNYIHNNNNRVRRTSGTLTRAV